MPVLSASIFTSIETTIPTESRPDKGNNWFPKYHTWKAKKILLRRREIPVIFPNGTMIFVISASDRFQYILQAAMFTVRTQNPPLMTHYSLQRNLFMMILATPLHVARMLCATTESAHALLNIMVILTLVADRNVPWIQIVLAIKPVSETNASIHVQEPVVTTLFVM